MVTLPSDLRQVSNSDVVRVVTSGYFDHLTARPEHSIIQYQIPAIENYYRITVMGEDRHFNVKIQVVNVEVSDSEVVVLSHMRNRQPGIITFHGDSRLPTVEERKTRIGVIFLCRSRRLSKSTMELYY